MYVKALVALFILFCSPAIVFGQVISFNLDPKRLNKKLALQLDSLFREDQELRFKLFTLQKEKAADNQLDDIKALIKSKDSTNLILVENLIGKYGWLSPNEIGIQGAQALFLVIQHASLDIQKKYYPLNLDAEKNGKILSSNVAFLEDRIAVREGRLQTYGSQGYYDKERKKLFVYPLKDVENIDELRRKRGLPKMKEYIKDWDLQDYNSYLPHAQILLKKYGQQ